MRNLQIIFGRTFHVALLLLLANHWCTAQDIGAQTDVGLAFGTETGNGFRAAAGGFMSKPLHEHVALRASLLLVREAPFATAGVGVRGRMGSAFQLGTQFRIHEGLCLRPALELELLAGGRAATETYRTNTLSALRLNMPLHVTQRYGNWELGMAAVVPIAGTSGEAGPSGLRLTTAWLIKGSAPSFMRERMWRKRVLPWSKEAD